MKKSDETRERPVGAMTGLPEARKLVRPLALTMVTMLILMSLYELAKQSLLPSAAIWKSPATTILFSSAVGTIAACFAWRSNWALLRQSVTMVPERGQAEEALRRTELLYRALFEQANDAIFVNNEEDAILDANQRACELLGYSREELLDMKVPDLQAPEVRGQVGSVIRTELEQHGGVIFESMDIHRDGRRIPVEVSTSRVVGLEEELVLSIVRDITERERVEQALKASEEYTRSIIDSSLDLIITCDADRRIVEFNRAAQHTFGYRREEVIGKHVDMLYADPQEGLAVHEITIQEGKCVREILDKRKNGEEFPAFLSSSVLRDAGGEIVGVMGVARDITERKRAEETLQRRTAQLEALREVGLEITAQLELDALLHSIASRSIELLGRTEGGLYLYRPDRDVLEWTVAIGPHTAPVGSILHRGEGLSGKVWERGESLIVDDYRHWEGHADVYGAYPFAAVVGVPIHWGKEFLGVLNVLADTPQAFSPADAELLSSFATQAAIAIRNAHLYTAERKRAVQLAVVNQVAWKAVSILEPDRLLQEIVTAIQQGFGYHNVILLQLDEAGSELGSQAMAGGFASVAPPDYRQAVGEGLIGRAAKTGRPIMVNDVQKDPHYIVGFVEEVPTRSEMCIPLKLADQTIGVLDIQETRPNAFDETDLVALETLAGQIAIAIDNARLYHALREELGERTRAERALRQRNRELAMLNRASWALVSILELDQVIVTVLEEVRHLLDVVACSVWLIAPETGELVCRQATGPHSETVRGWRLAPGEGIAGWVVRSGTSVIVPDTWADERYSQDVEERIDIELRSIISVPLRVRDDVIGVLQVVDTHPDRFSTNDLELLEPLAASAAIAIENAGLYKRARQDAETRAMLLREVNHRVKNNLSGIIGLLYAARRHAKVEDQATYESTMNDLIGRVRGLATVHSMLSASQWEPLALDDLATRIIHVGLAPLPQDRRVSVDVSPSAVRVTSDQAHNLALVINELTTNTVKHALGERDTAHIAFRITRDDDRVRCEFRDDGPGYAEDALRLERQNVGFDLIRNIVRKGLRGELSLHNDDGAVAVIQFRAEA